MQYNIIVKTTLSISIKKALRLEKNVIKQI
jgi:hypothetical protein